MEERRRESIQLMPTAPPDHRWLWIGAALLAVIAAVITILVAR